MGPFRKRGVFNELTWFPRIPFSCFMQKLRFFWMPPRHFKMTRFYHLSPCFINTLSFPNKKPRSFRLIFGILFESSFHNKKSVFCSKDWNKKIKTQENTKSSEIVLKRNFCIKQENGIGGNQVNSLKTPLFRKGPTQLHFVPLLLKQRFFTSPRGFYSY